VSLDPDAVSIDPEENDLGSMSVSPDFGKSSFDGRRNSFKPRALSFAAQEVSLRKPQATPPNPSLRGASRARIWSQFRETFSPARSARNWRQILAALARRKD
jgi:hypothetical protein